MKLEDFETLFIDELADLYSAEKQLIKALPKLAKGAESPELRQAFEDHLEETRKHAERLEQIMQKVNGRKKSKTCKGMAGLIEEGSEFLDATGDPNVIDAGLISAAQRVEHYEIAGYGSVRTYAEMLGETKAARLLQQTLDEEKAADEKLNELAENLVNPKAATADEA